MLKDPKQRRFFKSNDLYELFTLDSCDKRYGTETSAIFAGSNCEVKVPGSRKRKKKEAKREEQEKPKASAKMSAKRTVKESSKTEERDEQEAAGGAFSIDWRDIAEARSLTKNEAREKDMEKGESKEVDAKSNEEESAAQVVVIDEEKGDNSAKLNEATIEDLAEDVAPTLHPDLNIAEKGESTSSTCEVPTADKQHNALIPSQSEEGSEPKRKHTVTFAVDDHVHKQSDSGSPQKATGVKSRKGKGKISSLSDEELKKRIRLKQKKKKRRRASK